MKNIMSDLTAVNCWESVYGQESPCMWCKAPTLLANLKSEVHPSQTTVDNGYIVYEHFNEVANRWYQLQEKVVKLKDFRTVLISIALDISLQKEAQSKLIDTHVKLTKQTQALQEAKAQLKEQANHDPLTNMYNRRYFNEIAQKIVAIIKRSKEPLSLLMIDIDKFKNINDTYGHHVGDKVIKLLALKLQEAIRESDIAARIGGEEFALILPNTDKERALELAQKIRKDMEMSSCKVDDKSVTFTVSIGVDEFEHTKDDNLFTALNRADAALYLAKASGRNRVCLYSEIDS